MRRISGVVFLLLVAFLAVANGECPFCFQDDEVDDLVNASPNMGTITRSCTDLKAEYQAREEQLAKVGNENQCIEFQLEGYQTGCCNQVDPDGCGVCPDGSPVGADYTVPTEGSEDPAPEECEGYAFQPYANNGIFIPGSCADTRAQRSAFYCACPGARQEVWLCPDQQPPGRRRRGDFTRSQNCGQTEYLFSIFKADEVTDINTDFGFHFQSWCECPGVILENSYDCGFCPDGQGIKEGFHNKVFNEETAAVDINGKYDYRRTCAQVADFTRYVTADFQCSNANVETARLFCCAASGLGMTLTMVITGAMLLQSLFF
jgi:hypothetical protein